MRQRYRSSWILNPEIGLINGLLRIVRHRRPAWLEDHDDGRRWSLVLMSLWGVGGSMVIYLARA